jgi:hypothetical protein
MTGDPLTVTDGPPGTQLWHLDQSSADPAGRLRLTSALFTVTARLSKAVAQARVERVGT